MPTPTVSIHVPMFETNAPVQNRAKGRRRRGASDPGTCTPEPFHTDAAPTGVRSATISLVAGARTTGVLAAAALLGAAVLAAGCGDDDPRARISGATDRARCMADGARATFGPDVVDAVREARDDIDALGDIASAKGHELRAALDDCVDVQQTLTDALVDAGLSQGKAECVATRALHDDTILGPLLVTMVFGDPGVTTAVAVAVRAGGPCLDADDFDGILPR
jgi:hypothetical protein